MLQKKITDHESASYFLEGMIGGIPYQRRQIRRLEEDLEILREETYRGYHSPNLMAWDDGSFQAHRTGSSHNSVLDMISKEKRITEKIQEIQAQIEPVERFISSLPQEDREILTEHYWRHRSYESIGLRHAMSRETVRRAVSRILMELDAEVFEA